MVYKQTKEHIEKRVSQFKGENSPKWLGDKIGYTGLHKWVARVLGKPDTCEDCGKSGLKGCQIHWANINGLYQRVKTDWKRLCVKCHAKLDKNCGRGGDHCSKKYRLLEFQQRLYNDN